MQQMKQNQQNTGLQIAFASSQEPDEGDAAYLVDGDPSTILAHDVFHHLGEVSSLG